MIIFAYKKRRNQPSKVTFLLYVPRLHYKNEINNKVMIRVFYAFGKSKFNKMSDLSLFHEACATFSRDDFVCPKCGRKHDCSFIQPYGRYLITLENNLVVTHRIRVQQVRCSSCDSIHAILPDCLVPHSSYSLSFILTFLKAYFLGALTIESLCSKFSIAISTLYAWIKLFFLHKKLWLGLLRDHETSNVDFLNLLLSSDFSSISFFSLTAFSFMQGAFTTSFNSS